MRLPSGNCAGGLVPKRKGQRQRLRTERLPYPEQAVHGIVSQGDRPPGRAVGAAHGWSHGLSGNVFLAHAGCQGFRGWWCSRAETRMSMLGGTRPEARNTIRSFLCRVGISTPASWTRLACVVGRPLNWRKLASLGFREVRTVFVDDTPAESPASPPRCTHLSTSCPSDMMSTRRRPRHGVDAPPRLMCKNACRQISARCRQTSAQCLVKNKWRA